MSDDLDTLALLLEESGTSFNLLQFEILFYFMYLSSLFFKSIDFVLNS